VDTITEDDIAPGAVETTEILNETILTGDILNGTLATVDFASTTIDAIRARAVVTTTTGITLDSTHSVVLCNNSSGITITLPTAAAATSRTYYIKKINATAVDVKIDGDGAETIDGAAFVTLYVQYDSIKIISDGTQWHIIEDRRIAHHSKMHRAAGQSISHNTTLKVEFDTESFDVGNIADTVTNNEFVIKRAGTYLITGFIMMVGLDDTEYVALYIYVNGTFVHAQIRRSVANPNTVELEIKEMVTLAVSDTVDLRVFHNEGAAISTSVSTLWRPRLSIEEIR